MLKLYHFDRSPFGWKVRLVLAEKGIPWEGIVPQDKANDPAFGRLNPFRMTPVLQLADGRTIYESTVINEYLEETHPSPPMLPSDPYERARVRMIEDTTDQQLYPAIRAVTTARFEYAPPVLIRRKPADVNERQFAEALPKLHDQLARLDAALEGRTWFGGEVFSLADAALAAPLTATLPLLGILPDPRYERLARWTQRIAERPSYRASAPKEPTRIRED